jgi:hypothetical protein
LSHSEILGVRASACEFRRQQFSPQQKTKQNHVRVEKGGGPLEKITISKYLRRGVGRLGERSDFELISSVLLFTWEMTPVKDC